jgi:putative transposase
LIYLWGYKRGNFLKFPSLALRVYWKTGYNNYVSIICNKFRLYPSKAQETALNETLAVCRLVYNSLVHERTALHEQGLKSPTYYTQAPAITRWKKVHPELKTVHSQVLQNVAIRVELAFQAFFRHVKAGETPGYPRLKGEGQYDSITYPGSGFKIGEASVWLSLFGKPVQVKAKIHRPVIGKVKTCTVRRYGSKWFVCFSVEQPDDFMPPCSQTIGLDAGLNSFMALSNGEFVDNPRFFRKDEKALAKAGRRQAKTAKRSKERRKANKVLSRVHERIRNRRHDFVHQTARKIVNRYGVIAVEKLNVKGMVQNHCLAKSISDASWSMFRTVLTQKAESAGRDANGTALREVIAVNPAYTSQGCHACGYRAKKALKERWHFCPNCSASLDRDTNAAINILNLATGTSHAGITACQGIPVEAPPFMAGE